MTTKRYFAIVSDYRTKKLSVDVGKSKLIHHCQPNLFLVQFIKSTLLHLQHLATNAHLQHFDLNQLNHFARLVQLKIGYELQEDGKVRLSELRELEITCNRKFVIRIDSAKLQKLTYYGKGSLMQVEHPETVITLDTDLPGILLKLFRNVRYLYSSSNLRIPNERTLLDYPDLKEIAYTGSYDDVFEAFEESGEWEVSADLSPYLERFMAKKKALGRSDLKVRFVWLELIYHRSIDDYRFDDFFADYDDQSHGSFNLIEFHAHNHPQLMDTACIPSARYREFLRLVQRFHPQR